MRKKFSSMDQVCHVWAQRSQHEGEAGNVFFDNAGDTIYSYGRHFPIAHFIDRKGDSVCVLVNSETYSVSTSKHQYSVKNAIRHYNSIYIDSTKIIEATINLDLSVPDLRKAFKKLVVKHVETVIKYQLSKAVKRRLNHLAFDDLSVINGTIHQCDKLLKVYGLTLPKSLSKQYEGILGSFNRPINMYKVEAEKAAKKLKAKQATSYKEAVKLWLGGNTALVNMQALRSGNVVMRINANGETVTTSQGATFPIKDAIIAFRCIAATKNANKSWERNGENITLGHFHVDSISANGDVTAGCHFIKWDAVASVAERLGIYTPEG